MKSESEDLINFIRNELITDKQITFTPSTKLFENRLIDSINILALIGFVEDKLGKRLTDDEVVMKNFTSVDSIEKAFWS